MTDLSLLVGSVLREVRQRQGWSQERLAERSGLDRSFVGEIERGVCTPSLTTVEKLAQALGMTTSEFIGRCEARRGAADAGEPSLAGNSL